MRRGMRGRLKVAQGIGVLLVLASINGCKKEAHTHQWWTVEASFIDGTYPHSFWMQTREIDPVSHSWWQSPSYHSLSDTLWSPNGEPCSFYGPIDLSQTEFLGEWSNPTGSSYAFQINQHFQTSDNSIQLVLNSPFWIQLIGGRNENDSPQDGISLVRCDWCEEASNKPMWFTPGRQPKPALILKGYVYPGQTMPARRSFDLIVPGMGVERTVSIDIDHIGDTASIACSL